jgi:hypothetical protein
MKSAIHRRCNASRPRFITTTHTSTYTSTTGGGGSIRALAADRRHECLRPPRRKRAERRLRLECPHLGASGEAGYAAVMHDGPEGTDRAGNVYAGAAGLVQLDLATRLALQARGGAAWLPALADPEQGRSEGRVFAPEASLGVAVY